MPSNDDDPVQYANSSYKLELRFGDEIIQAGWTVVPNVLLRYQAKLEISASELTFILQVWYHWWDLKDPYPALPTVSQRMGQSRRQVNRYVEALKDKGYLIVKERKSAQRGQITSEYDFSPLLDKLRELYRQEHSDRDPSGG